LNIGLIKREHCGNIGWPGAAGSRTARSSAHALARPYRAIPVAAARFRDVLSQGSSRAESRRERFSKMQEDRARAVSVTEETAGGSRSNREPRNTLIRTYLRAVWMGRGKGSGTGAALVKDCTTQPFCLMWNSSYGSDRPPRSIEWFERALDCVALPGG